MADFSLVAELKANTSNFISGIKKGEESLKGFGGIVDKILGPKGKLVMAIATATTAALKLGQSMNKAMAEVAKGTGATGKELEKFRGTLDQVLEKGVNSSTKEIAKVMADVNTRFKLTGEELANLTVDFDKFATATGVDVKNSVEKVADVLAKWNIETEDATGLMDQLTVASQETGVSVDNLLGELKTGQAIFSQLGMSATDTIAYLGTLKENGIDSSVALTGLRTALAKWSQEGKNAQQEFKLVAEKIKNAKTETEALNISVANFGARSGAEMVKVLRNSANSADELKDKLIAAGGAVERTAEATRTSKEAFKGLGDTLKASFSGLFVGLDNLFKGLADSLNNLFRILNPLIEPLFNAVKDILTMVGNVLSNLTSEIKNYVTEYSVAFNSIVAATNSAYQFIHGIMGYLEESFGTVFGFIFSLLEGRFGLAWEYLKKNLLINVKFILDIVSKLVNAVKDQLNTLIEKGINPIIEKINWAQEKLGKKKTEKLSLIENFDLAGITGIDKKIEDVTKKIETLSGKSKKKIVGDLGAVNTEFDDISVSVQGEVEKTGKKAEEEEEEAKKKALETARIIANGFNNALKGIAKGFATAFKTIGNIISKIGSLTVKAVKGLMSLCDKIIDFSVSDSLDALLKFEDGILTFFVEVLPQLPGFLRSALQSISVMLSQISGRIGSLGDIFEDMLKTVITAAPAIFSDIVNILSGIFTQMVTAIGNNADEIVNAFGSMFFMVAEALPDIINTLFDTIGKLLAGLGDYLTSNQQRLEDDLKNIVDSIVKGITKFIESGGLKKLLDGLIAVQQAIENAVADNIDEIADFIEEALPDIAEFLENSIVSASKTLGKIAPRLLKALGGIIGTIFAVAFDPDVIESSFDAIEGIISGLIQAIVNFVVKIIPALIEGIVRAPQAIPKLIMGIIGGLIDGLTSVNWLDVVKSVFEGFINGFKELFGIHSPSTVFEGFGNNITEGLEIGLKGFTEVLEVLLEPLETVVNNLTDFSKTGEGFEKMFNGIANIVKISGKVIIGVLGGVVQAMADVHNELRDIIKSVTEIKVWTPWKTYKIGGVDIGKVTAPDISKYVSIIDALADGTDNARKGLTLVGEAGPELVNFRGGEQVLNNHNTQKALDNMGGSTNNFNVTFNNLQDTSAFTMLQQLKAYNRQMAINGIL